MRQKTLKEKISVTGIGLHSGQKVRCVLHPAPAHFGIVFVRSDLIANPHIKADISKVSRTDLCTTLSNGDASISTVEHLMAAFAGLGIDNAIVEVNAPELPILDGSSKEFVDAILAAGIRILAAPKKVLRLKQAVSIQSGDKWIEATPARKLHIKASISFAHQAIGDQIYRYSLENDFTTEIASARTFGFLKEVEFLHRKGLALGGSLENAIVLDDERILNPEGLRFQNEFIRHKILDAVGDFALLGMQLEASVEIHKSGHELHAAFLRKILSDTANYEVVEYASEKPAIEVVEELQPALAY